MSRVTAVNTTGSGAGNLRPVLRPWFVSKLDSIEQVDSQSSGNSGFAWDLAMFLARDTDNDTDERRRLRWNRPGCCPPMPAPGERACEPTDPNPPVTAVCGGKVCECDGVSKRKVGGGVSPVGVWVAVNGLTGLKFIVNVAGMMAMN